ncbi:MAG: FixH family protein [Sphingobacteriaceae bacterium]
MNWGTKLVIGMLVFMAFIVGLALLMMTSKSDDLIENDYYQKGLEYTKEYNSQKAVQADGVLPSIQLDSLGGLRVRFTQVASYSVTFKRLSNGKLDKVLSGTDSVITMAPGQLVAGLWLLRLTYKINNKNYSLNRELVVP